MSSHHIVRDEQEPALLLWQPGQLSYSQVGELLAWSPQVLVNCPALPEALGWGIKLDALCGPVVELEKWLPQLAHQQPLTSIELENSQDLSPLVDWLRERGQRRLNLSLAPEAPEQWRWAAQEKRLHLSVLSRGWQYVWVKDNFSKWVPAGFTYRLRQADGRLLDEYTCRQSGWLSLNLSAPGWLGWPLSS